MDRLELPKSKYQMHRQIEIKNLSAFFITLKKEKTDTLQKELSKRHRARYDTKMDGNGWLEVSSDGMPLCQVKYSGNCIQWHHDRAVYAQQISESLLRRHSLGYTKENLSGGEKQKPALARVLIENKKVVFLNEATANMDKDSSQNILSQLLGSDGLTVISIEHKVSPEILSMYDKILELKDAHLEERM